jgi:diguanylate cyclase (GGDEF)-like protein/PAS domain S-box-containing protein
MKLLILAQKMLQFIKLCQFLGAHDRRHKPCEYNRGEMPRVKDTDKTREQRIKKVASLRQQIAELKRMEIEHKRAEEALRGSEEELEAIFKDARIGIAIFDKTGKILRVNKRLLELGGYTEKEVVGKRFNLLKMFPPKSIATMLANFTKLISGKEVPPFDVEVYTKSGEKLITELHGSLLRKQGKVAGMVGIIRDISERRQTEELLKKERESFFSILQEAPNGVALINKDGKYLYINTEFSNITGYTLKNIPTGKDWFRKAYPDPQYRQQVIETWKGDIARGAIDRVFSVVCKNGAVKEIEFRGTVLEDKRAIVILTDITERKHAEEAYHVVVEHSLQGLHILQDQREVFANSAYAEMLGYTVEELLALSPKKTTKLVYPEDQERVWGYYRDHLEGKSVRARDEFRIIRKDGSLRWVEAFSSRIEYRGKPAVQVAMVDITERKHAEATLKNSEERYRTLVESSTDAILMLNRNRNVITCNQAFLNLFGYHKGEVQGKSIRIIHRSEESFRTYDKATYPLVERVGSLREEWDFIRKDGTIFPAEIVTSPVRSPDGKTAAYICIIRDITERKRAEEELEYMATHDVLTGLPNRTLFNDRLTIALTHARRSQKKLAVMLLDLDYFKDVNDTLGHSMGDQLLCVVGNRLTEVLRKGDTVARIGGDEFLLLLPEIARIEDASTIAQKILESFRTPFTFDNQQLYITTSIGIVFFPDDGDDPDTLVKNADIAMYRAKERGRDTFQCYSSAPR